MTSGVSGNPFEFLIAFGWGVLAGCSPCCYPLLPVTIGFIGASGQKSKLQGLVLSLIYVMGLAITYSVLGLIASLTGKLFGQISSHPLSYFIVANVCIVFGLSMLGLFQIKIPVLLFPSKKGTSKFSVFFLGIVSGLVIGPCTAPFLGSALVYVATKQNLLYGSFLLFCFAYGMGALLILAGTFSGFLLHLPKSGIWMERVEKAGGVILILAGEYFLINMGKALI